VCEDYSTVEYELNYDSKDSYRVVAILLVMAIYPGCWLCVSRAVGCAMQVLGQRHVVAKFLAEVSW
jgi:hypothetical protein